MKSTYQYSVIGVVLSVFLAALMSACWSSAPPAAPPPSTYYVSASGNDNNAGTSEDAPLATLTKAYQKDRVKTIVVMGVLDVEAGVTLQVRQSDVTISGKPNASDDERAVLRGNDKGSVLRLSGFGSIRLEHITVTGGNADGTGGGIQVRNSTMLTLGPGAVITGNQAKNGGGVYVEGPGELTLEGGAITDNTATESGGGLYLLSGKAAIKSGSISGNQAQSGGGVYAGPDAELTLEGGEIANNLAITTAVLSAGVDGATMLGYGGGVAAFNFTMKGGSISGNTVNGGVGMGGGVAIRNANLSKRGTFIMEGGEITNNTAKGKVSTGANMLSEETAWQSAVEIFGNFTLRNGKIAHNPCKGVSISSSFESGNASFIMEGGEITGNTFYGVDLNSVNFTMRSGVISGNLLGVSLDGSSFTMRGGEITNNSTSGDSLAAGIIYKNSTVTIQGGKVSGNMVKGKEVNIVETK
jgi:hypothetical protein